MKKKFWLQMKLLGKWPVSEGPQDWQVSARWTVQTVHVHVACAVSGMRRKLGCHPPCVNRAVGRYRLIDSVLTLIAQILALLCVLEWICQPQCACLLIWEKKDDTNRTILLGLCDDWLIYVYVRWNFCLEPRQCLAMCARVPEYCHLCRGTVGCKLT